MKRGHSTRVVLLALIAGLSGGVLSNALLSGQSALADAEKTTDLIRARAFEIVDEDGVVRVRVSVSPARKEIESKQKVGTDSVTVRYHGTDAPSAPRLEFMDADGSVIWKAPPETGVHLLR